MHASAYLVLAILGLIVIAVVFVFLVRRGPAHLSLLTSAALACVVAGIAFGETRWVGYTFIGSGVALAVVGRSPRRARATDSGVPLRRARSSGRRALVPYPARV